VPQAKLQTLKRGHEKVAGRLGNTATAAAAVAELFPFDRSWCLS
jgi:hypothetical protein